MTSSRHGRVLERAAGFCPAIVDCQKGYMILSRHGRVAGRGTGFCPAMVECLGGVQDFVPSW